MNLSYLRFAPYFLRTLLSLFVTNPLDLDPALTVKVPQSAKKDILYK